MSVRKLIRSGWVQQLAGFIAAEYLRLVWLTNRVRYDPVDVYDIVEPHMPLIISFWHGQHFMMPFLRLRRHSAKVLVSRHADGEINAIAAGRLGIGAVRGSGDHGREFHRKGGVSAFKEMVRTLGENVNMALTADVPKVARKAGLGIIMLARESGRPIVPVAIVTSRFVRLNNWDRTVIPLPFGTCLIMGGEIVTVPPDADAAAMEAARAKLEAELNAAQRRAYAAIGRPDGMSDG